MAGRSSRRRRRRRRAFTERGALDLTNEAVNLLRTAPLRVLVCYYAGAVPFVLGLLFFWADMSRSAFAYRRCFGFALLVALLFVWMKLWHVLFARGLRSELQGRPLPALSPARFRRLAAMQLALQPYGLIAIPLAMLLAVPFYSVYGFYQNLTALGDGGDAELRTLVRRAWRQATLWPRQSHILMWFFCPWILGAGMLFVFGGTRLALSTMSGLPLLDNTAWFIFSLLLIFNFLLPLCPFGCAVAANVAVSITLLPSLLKGFLGIETLFTISGWHGIFNTTFLITVFGLTYLCLDPLIKSAYVLRCFYGESRRTGDDLRAELKEAVREREARNAAPAPGKAAPA